MAVVVSLINMKGGVGKTAIATHLARMAPFYGYRTLAIDIDPQANLSQALLGGYDYHRHLQEARPTIASVLEGYQPPRGRRGAPESIHVSSAITTVKSGSSTSIDLLPSHFELSYTLKQQSGINVRSLAQSLKNVADEYHLIVIDCAPTESILTEVAYHASRFLIVPVRPEYLATVGLPLLQESLRLFSSGHRRHQLDVAGVLINNAVSPSQQPRHRETRQSIGEIREIAAEVGWHVFGTQLPYSRAMPNSIREGRTLSGTRYASRSKALLDAFPEFCDELFRIIKPNRKEAGT
jgi:chromosome partitioning protein